MKELRPEERLIVAADFKPSDCQPGETAAKKVIDLAFRLAGLDVCIKVNSALRENGYDLIFALRNAGLKVFADLKLNDIPETMGTDAALISRYQPDILTVMCSAGVEGMQAVKKAVNPDCLVVGVTVLTSLKDTACKVVFNRHPEEAVLSFAALAINAGLDGLVLSPLETEIVRKEFGSSLMIINPGIRPLGAKIANDDQSRIATPGGAIKNGADMIVVGRPITQAENPCEAAKTIIEEIKKSLTT